MVHRRRRPGARFPLPVFPSFRLDFVVPRRSVARAIDEASVDRSPSPPGQSVLRPDRLEKSPSPPVGHDGRLRRRFHLFHLYQLGFFDGRPVGALPPPPPPLPQSVTILCRSSPPAPEGLFETARHPRRTLLVALPVRQLIGGGCWR